MWLACGLDLKVAMMKNKNKSKRGLLAGDVLVSIRWDWDRGVGGDGDGDGKAGCRGAGGTGYHGS